MPCLFLCELDGRVSPRASAVEDAHHVCSPGVQWWSSDDRIDALRSKCFLQTKGLISFLTWLDGTVVSASGSRSGSPGFESNLRLTSHSFSQYQFSQLGSEATSEANLTSRVDLNQSKLQGVKCYFVYFSNIIICITDSWISYNSILCFHFIFLLHRYFMIS